MTDMTRPVKVRADLRRFLLQSRSAGNATPPCSMEPNSEGRRIASLRRRGCAAVAAHRTIDTIYGAADAVVNLCTGVLAERRGHAPGG